MTLPTLQKNKDQLDQEKQTVARAAVRWVKNGMRLGLGTGSTANYFITFLGERLRSEGLRIEAIASSNESETRARKEGIPLIEPKRGLRLDLGVDGADEVASDLSLIKGGGGALLREKVVARASRYFLVIADSSKRVERLGAFPLPVEVVPFALPWVMDQIAELGAEPIQRMSANKPFRTDQQNWVVDCHFRVIRDPVSLAARLKDIPGIAEHGLFVGYARAALIGDGKDLFVLRPGQPPRPVSDFNELP
jgi:ribose 5-phosphate isomerase A